MVAFDEAEGRIAAESLAAYPPGVPNVLPGERLTRPTLDYIADSVAHGGLVRGASDRTLKTIRVVARLSWGADSETGVLRDVLLGPPENFRWLPTSAISKATLESGAQLRRRARPEPAPRAGLDLRVRRGRRSTRLEPDPALPYQVFARDSSVMTPQGAVVTQLKQQWRRGEYAPVIRFYEANEIPIARMITAGAIEGGDVTIVEPGVHADRQRRGADRDAGARASSPAGWRPRAGRCGSSRSRASSSTSTCSSRSWRRSWPPSASSRRPAGWSPGCADKGFEILEVSTADAFKLGVNAISLGDERVISTAGSAKLNEQMRSLGLEVFDPDLSMFTRGGGGAHCLAQALDRDPGG